MDELVEGLAKVIGVLLLVGLAIYLLILAIPFILYGCAVFYGGRAFARQLGRYELTEKTRLALCAVGAAAIGITLLYATSAGKHPVYLFLAVPLFFGLALATLAVWASFKEQPYAARLQELASQTAQAEERVQGFEGEMSRLAAQVTRSRPGTRPRAASGTTWRGSSIISP